MKRRKKEVCLYYGEFSTALCQKGKLANCDALHNNTEKSLLMMIYFMMTVITIIDCSDETKKKLSFCFLNCEDYSALC